MTVDAVQDQQRAAHRSDEPRRGRTGRGDVRPAVREDDRRAGAGRRRQRAGDLMARPVETLRWAGDRLELIDQRLLPQRVEYVACDDGRGGRRGDPRHGGARRAGDRLRGGLRGRARVRAGRPAAQSANSTRRWRRRSRCLAREPADGGQPVLGARAHAPRCRARSEPSLRSASPHACSRKRRDPSRGHRGEPCHRPPRCRAGARRGAGHDPLQRRRAGDGRPRHGARRRPHGPRRGQAHFA